MAIVAAAFARAARGPAAHRSALVANLALLDWAYQEITTGANWFRQLLGLGGAAYGAAMLRQRASLLLAAHRRALGGPDAC